MGEVEGVSRVSDLHAWSLTTGYNALSAHVVGGEELDADAREQLARELSVLIREQFAIHHVTLQVEPECRMGDRAHCGDWLEECASDEAEPGAGSQSKSSLR
jgi:hypothetical protein